VKPTLRTREDAERWLQRHGGGWHQAALAGGGVLVTAYAYGTERDTVAMPSRVEDALVRAVTELAAALEALPN
jgi:hypothetical protein